MATENVNTEGFVTGEDIEPDESRTPTEFADEEWMSLDQVANYFQVPATRVREWVSNGMFAVEPHGSIERIKRTDIERIGNPDDNAAQEFESDH